jgi:hypothetical protein
MKGRFGSFLIAAVAISAGFYGWSPGHTLRGLAAAIEARDAVEMEERVEFPTLREGLKAQLNSVVLDRMDAALGGTTPDDPLVSGLQSLGAGLALALVDGMVDGFVTPSGLAELSRGMAPGAGGGDRSGLGAFDDVRVDRETLDRFSAWVPAQAPDMETELRFVFRRFGLHWKLTNIVLPDDLWPDLP